MHITVHLTVVGGDEYANLGSGNLAQAVAAHLVRTHGGHQVRQDNEYLYFNGGIGGDTAEFRREWYQELVNKALHQ